MNSFLFCVKLIIVIQIKETTDKIKKHIPIGNTILKFSFTFSFISDLIFTFFLVSLFTLCLFRFWRIPLMPALLLALLCGTLSTGALGAFLQSKRNALFLKKSEEETMEKLLLHLALLGDDKKLSLFQNALGDENNPVKKHGKKRLFTKDECYFLEFRFAPVETDDISALARLKTAKKKFLLCNRIDEQALKFCKDWKNKNFYCL